MKRRSLTLLCALTLATSLFSATLSKEITNATLVVYNSNIGLVHEERELDIKQGDTSILYEDVANTINTDSINIQLDSSITLKSQQFRYDKITQAKLLNAHIGKKIEVRLLRNRNEFKVITATLLSNNGTYSIVKTIDYKILTVKSNDIILEEIPKELITKPSLVWNVDVNKSSKSKLKLDYLINNISFQSNYVLNIENNTSTLNGWVSITNNSGKRFEDTRLALLAGDIQRSHKNPSVYYKNMETVSSAPQVKEQSFEGYHFYTIPFNVTLANKENTQIKFITKENLKTSRVYSTRLSNPLYMQGERKVAVSQYIVLEKLDTPLPKGTIRIYSQLDGQTILLGEDRVVHTPKNTPLKFKTGKNFDVKIKESVRKRSDSKNFLNVDLTYTVQNSSNNAKTVTLQVPFNTQADSKITTGEAYTFTKGNLVTFKVVVNANSTKEIQVNYESRR